MDSHSQIPRPPFRTVSTSSLGSSASITRVALGPIKAMGAKATKKIQEDQLYMQCERLRRKMEKIEGMEPFMEQALEAAELSAEQQALALSQLQKDIGNRNENNGFRSSVGSVDFSVHSDTSLTSGDGGDRDTGARIYTFTAGALPSNIIADPVTLMCKLFQQGAPLCILFNYAVSNYQIPVIGSDDLRVCKKSIYDFLIAVKMHLNFDDDSMFTISNVFLDSTHDLFKIVKIVDRLMNMTKSASTVDAVETIPLGELAISDDRSKVVKEIVETERQYVHDLELLLTYRNELQEAGLISGEQIDMLFPNLNDIVDFQRRFLNGLECNVSVAYKYQRLGSLFIHAARGPFRAYEPWTIGQLAAVDLIHKEKSNLKKSSSLIDPGFELQSYILKPIQRLCKYPLLIKELIKATPEVSEDNAMVLLQYNELLVAHIAIKEVANEVNEAQRRSENVGFVQSLSERVHNWRGFSLKDQGELLYHAIVAVRDSDYEKEYVAYLFEKIIFFFIDTTQLPSKDKESKKVRDLLTSRKKSSSYSSSASLSETFNGNSRDKSPLELKGRVYIQEIYNIQALNNNILIISWSGKKESGSFTLRYKTEEVRNQWESCLRNLKANEMHSIINRRLRDSQDSRASSDSLYDVAAAYGSSSPTVYHTNAQHDSYSRSSSGSSQRHHSSSSTFSMMRQVRSRSDHGNARTSSSSLAYVPTASHAERSGENVSLVSIKLIYNKVEISENLIVPTNISFNELHLKISSTVASSGQVNDDILVSKLRYKDEDGDFVVMDSNDDWTLAIDMLYEYASKHDSDEKTLSIWVS